MNTKFFFPVATLLLTATTNFFCVSCKNEEMEELDNMSEYVQNSKRADTKIIDVYADIAEDIADFYVLKATYEYQGEEIVEVLDDMNKTEEITECNKNGEPCIVKYKKYKMTKQFGNSPVTVKVIATPKSDAIAKMETKADDAVLNCKFAAKVLNQLEDPAANSGVRRLELRGLSKEKVIKFIGGGDRVIETKRIV